MAKIDRLTSEQERLLAEQLDYWLQVGRSTVPLDRPAATDAICAIYQATGRPRPTVLFFSSPAMCILAWGALRALGTNQDLPWGELRRKLPGYLMGELGGELGDRLWGELEDQLRSQPAGQPGEPLWGELWGELGHELGEELEGQLGGQLGEQLRGRLWDRLPGQLRRQFAGQLLGWLWGQLRGHLWGELQDQLENFNAATWAGGWDVFYDYCNRIGVSYTSQRRATLDLWLTQNKHCHWWFPYEGIVLASERPCILTFDARGQLHNTSGPALAYSDGYGLHAWRGLRVAPRLSTDPASITVREIEHEQNAEVRRVMLELYGWSRYIQDCSARVVDSVPEDHPILGLRGSRLLAKELPGEPEPIVYLDMINSTPGPDGTHKHYLERIDPKAYNGDAGRLCQAAMASRWHHRDGSGALVRTFERWQDYLPTAES